MQDLSGMTVEQLKEKAKSLGMTTGLSSMTKPSLIEAIQKLESAKSSGQLIQKPATDNKASESSSEKNDYQDHPKFAKFNSQGSEAP